MFRPTLQRSMFVAMVLGCGACLVAAGSDQQPEADCRRDNPEPSSPIDRLVLQRLDRQIADLTPAEKRHAIVRRLSLDLTALPPQAAPATAPSTRPTTEPTEWSGVLHLEVDPQTIERWQQVQLAVPTTQAYDLNTVFLADPRQEVDLNPDLQIVAFNWVDKKENAAYLGVGVESPNDTVRAQLNLPDGAGLVVNYVDEHGPSKDAVHKHDVLQKLDDQILINGEQLVALVRMHKTAETVSLTLLRQARPVTVEVKLGEKQPESLEISLEPKGLNDAEILTTRLRGAPVLSKLPIVGRLYGGDADARPITFNDGEVLACLDGHGNLLAIQVKNGEQLFHGPIATEKQWQQVPELVRNKLSSWREMIAPRQGDPDSTGKTNAPDPK